MKKTPPIHFGWAEFFLSLNRKVDDAFPVSVVLWSAIGLDEERIIAAFDIGPVGPFAGVLGKNPVWARIIAAERAIGFVALCRFIDRSFVFHISARLRLDFEKCKIDIDNASAIGFAFAIWHTGDHLE